MPLIKHSTIEECLIKKKEEIISTNNNYHGVLVDIWNIMPAQKCGIKNYKNGCKKKPQGGYRFWGTSQLKKKKSCLGSQMQEEDR